MRGDDRRSILLQAAGVHAGGGRVLLDELIAAAGGRIRAATLDVRYIENSPGVEDIRQQGAELVLSRLHVTDRIKALTGMAKRGRSGDTLLHFNSLPPLVRSAAHTVVFLHAPYLVTPMRQMSYPPKIVARILFERMLLRLGAENADEYWVQTESMRQSFLRYYPNCRVRVVPFIDDQLADMWGNSTRITQQRAGNLFFYPADGMLPKNHVTLLRAWQLLREQGREVELALTLAPEVYDAFAKEASLSSQTLKGIRNLGPLPRAEVLEKMTQAAALIFPSKLETFGIPLLEATATGTPILASELDFVRDVCTPVETFDPNSPRSIARAVRRFIGDADVPQQPMTGAEFVEMLGR